MDSSRSARIPRGNTRSQDDSGPVFDFDRGTLLQGSSAVAAISSDLRRIPPISDISSGLEAVAGPGDTPAVDFSRRRIWNPPFQIDRVTLLQRHICRNPSPGDFRDLSPRSGRRGAKRTSEDIPDETDIWRHLETPAGRAYQMGRWRTLQDKAPTGSRNGQNGTSHTPRAVAGNTTLGEWAIRPTVSGCTPTTDLVRYGLSGRTDTTTTYRTGFTMNTHHALPATMTRGAVDMTPATADTYADGVVGIMLPNGNVIPVDRTTATSTATRRAYPGMGTYAVTGTHACGACGIDHHVKKFPTRPVNRHGIIARNYAECRAAAKTRIADGRTAPVANWVADDVAATTAPTTPATDDTGRPVDRVGHAAVWGRSDADTAAIMAPTGNMVRSAADTVRIMATVGA